MDDDILAELDGKKENPDVIRAIMERYRVDEKTAREIWHDIVDTVKGLHETHNRR
ncbi:MAG TPA: hypothetical protein VJZ26_08640 [Blastocatellia bacterium]|nr:hypothetical protein [Blastocatellia bacterium]